MSAIDLDLAQIRVAAGVVKVKLKLAEQKRRKDLEWKKLNERYDRNMRKMAPKIAEWKRTHPTPPQEITAADALAKLADIVDALTALIAAKGKMPAEQWTFEKAELGVAAAYWGAVAEYKESSPGGLTLAA